MSEYIIMTDSSCDLSGAMAKELELVVAPLSVTVDGKTTKNDLDEREMKLADFYAMMRQKKQVKTSAVNVGEFIELMQPALEAGSDILYLGFSSGLSGTYNAGELAAQELRAKYPRRKIITVDTLCASMGEGLIVYLAVQRKREGASIEEVRDWVEENKLHLCHWFTVEDLFHLMRGGRVSATTALVGTMLGIKPVMHVDDAGHLINMEKARGRNASLKRLCQITIDNAIDLKNSVVFISHGDCLKEAQMMERIVRDAGAKDVVISTIGPVVGAHSGPGTLAIFSLGKKR